MQLRSVVLLILSYNSSPYKKRKFCREELKQIYLFLEKHPYYANLSTSGKAKFFNRVMRFMVNKEFIGMEGLPITDEMRARVSACAIQITWGLDDYLLPYFKIFRIYPKEFYSRLLEKHLKGGTTQSGIVMLSWNNFEKGFDDPSDKYNLGLHEIAHAFLLNFLNSEPSYFSELRANVRYWEEAGEREMEKLRQRQPHFLRAYGGVNEHEFFAVSVEHFFEAPEDFIRHLPELYTRLCLMLKQNPLNAHLDYRLN